MDKISYAVIRLVTGSPQPMSMAPEILSKMRLPAGDLDPAAAAALLDDSVRLLYDAKLSAMTRRRRREMKSIGDDEMSSWLYDMCIDTMPETPPLKSRMMLSAACVRHVGRIR